MLIYGGNTKTNISEEIRKFGLRNLWQNNLLLKRNLAVCGQKGKLVQALSGSPVVYLCPQTTLHSRCISSKTISIVCQQVSHFTTNSSQCLCSLSCLNHFIAKFDLARLVRRDCCWWDSWPDIKTTIKWLFGGRFCTLTLLAYCYPFARGWGSR